MRTLSPLELLWIWEQGLAQQPVQRALMLLGAAYPEKTSEELAKLSIGQRDALLLTLREWMFGPQLASVATCPNCSDRLELNFNVSDIRVAPIVKPAEEFSLSIADYEMRFRLPNSLDLAALPAAGSANSELDEVAIAQEILLERCLLAIAFQGEAQSLAQLPHEVKQKVIEQMALADPQADVQLNLSCPSCRQQWQTTFDIVSFFWSEINAWAYRRLREIHALASAYGWRESDILALSPQRRQLYLEMVGG